MQDQVCKNIYPFVVLIFITYDFKDIKQVLLSTVATAIAEVSL